MGNQPSESAIPQANRSKLAVQSILKEIVEQHAAAVPAQGTAMLPSRAASAEPVGGANASASLRDEKIEALREYHLRNCDACGRPSTVSVLTNYIGGKPRFRHFCTICDEQECAQRRAYTGGNTASLIGSRILIIAGALIGFLGIVADSIQLKPSDGFGFWQQSGALICVALVVLGTVVRIGPVFIIGLAGLGLSLLADVIGPVGEAGRGWKQEAVIFFAVLLVVAGLYLARSGRTARKRHDPLSSASAS
ncbi:MAG: hypothetical protein AB7N71_07050 [Phycisphaerae bacterium]